MAIPFTISFWCGPPDNFLTRATPESVFSEMKQAGFNLAMPACNQSYDPPTVKRFLNAAAKAGIRAMIADNRIVSYSLCPPPGGPGGGGNPDWNHIESNVDAVVTDYSCFDNLYGYFLGDEPGGPGQEIETRAYFSKVVRIFNELRAKDPHRIGYINLLPFGYRPSFVDLNEYKQYLTDYITIANPQILSFDHYPGDWEGVQSNLYSANCRAMNEVCSAYGKQFWVIVGVFPPGYRESTTSEQLRWQVMEAIRLGASGILYFTYFNPPCASASEPALGLIDTSGNKTARFDELSKLNGDINSLVSRTGEALLGRVRATAANPSGEGDLWLCNSSDPLTGDGVNTARRLSAAPWSWGTQGMPGYSFLNAVIEVNGFWLSARNDLADRTFLVCNVVDNFRGGAGTLYRVTKSKVENLGGANWADANGRHVIGRYFDSSGFWVAIE